jgi:glycogen(starch) synthase
MLERVLTDDALRDGLVVEASEHVLRFDWNDVAARTRGVHRSLARGRAGQRA